MIVYNTYSDLLVALYKHISSIIPFEIGPNATFNIGNVTFQLNEKTAQYELPSMIVNFQNVLPYLDQPTQFQNVDIEHEYEDVVIYNESMDFSIKCYFSFRVVNIEVIINVESQLQLIEISEAMLNRFPLDKKLFQFEFGHFINIDPSLLASGYINPKTDRIHNLFYKHSAEVGTHNYYFMNRSKPLVSMMSLDSDISDINAETFTLRSNFNVLYRVPVKLTYPNLKRDPFVNYSALFNNYVNGSGGDDGSDNNDGSAGNNTTESNPSDNPGEFDNNDTTSLIDGLYNNNSNSDTDPNNESTTLADDENSNIIDTITLLGNNGIGGFNSDGNAGLTNINVADTNNNLRFTALVNESNISVPLKQSILLFIHNSSANLMYNVIHHVPTIPKTSNDVIEGDVIGIALDNETNFGTLRYTVSTIIDEYFSTAVFSNTLQLKASVYIITELTTTGSVKRMELKSNSISGKAEIISLSETEVTCWVTGSVYNFEISQELTFKFVSIISRNNVEVDRVQFFPTDPSYSLMDKSYINLRNVYNKNIKTNKFSSRISLKNYDAKFVYYSILQLLNSNRVWLSNDDYNLKEDGVIFENHVVEINPNANINNYTDDNDIAFISDEFEVTVDGINTTTPVVYTLNRTVYSTGPIENVELINNQTSTITEITFDSIFNSNDNLDNTSINTLKLINNTTNIAVALDFISPDYNTNLVTIPDTTTFKISFEYELKHYELTVNKIVNGVLETELSNFDYTLARKHICVYATYVDITFLHDENMVVGNIESISIILKEQEQGTILMKFGVFDTSQYISEYRHIIYDYNAVFNQLTENYEVKIKISEEYSLQIYQTYNWVFEFINEQNNIVTYGNNEQTDIVLDLDNSILDEYLLFNVSREVYFRLFSNVALANPAIFSLIR